MPHIAVITTSYPDGKPGADAAGSFVEDFARELARLARVTVVAASRSASITQEDTLTIRRFEVPRLPLSLLKAHNPFHWPAIAATLRAGRQALRDLIVKDAPDHVFALWALPCGWWARAEATPRGVPFSTWALGSDIWSLGRVPVISKQLSLVLNDASRRYADGIELAGEVERLCGKSCDFLPSARQLPAARKNPVSAEPPYKFAFLGRWHPNKGIDLLLDALGELGDEDWQRIEAVRIFGGGPLESEVRSACDRLADSGRPVTVGGYLDREAAASLIGWADYLLLPSRIESIPVIFSDAMQMGTPIICTPVGDLPRLHERHPFGIIADAPTERALAAAIRSGLYASPADFADAVTQVSKDFDVAEAAQKFLQNLSLVSE